MLALLLSHAAWRYLESWQGPIGLGTDMEHGRLELEEARETLHMDHAHHSC